MPKSLTPHRSASARSNSSPKSILKQRTLLDTARPLAPKALHASTRTSDIMHAMDIADEGPPPSQDSTPMDIQAPAAPSPSPIPTKDTLLSPLPAPPSTTQNPVTPTTPTPNKRSADEVEAIDINRDELPASSASAPMDIQLTDPPIPSVSNPSKRRSVAFETTHTVVEASTLPTAPDMIRTQLAPVFATTQKRRHVLFIKVKLPVEHKPKDPTVAARTKLKEFAEVLLQQDPSLILYKYKQTHKDETDACVKLSQLPNTITGLQSFMNGFRPSPDGGDVWGNLRIGIDSKADDFLENASQEAIMRKFWLRKAPLQAANTDYAGWLYLSPEAMDPEETAERINTYIKRACEQLGRPHFLIACERRMIWDDKAKSKDMSIKERNAKKALHIVCEKGRADDVAHFIRSWIRSAKFLAFTNIPMKYIPNFTRGQGRVYNMKFSRAVQKHMQLTAFGTRCTLSSDFENLDAPNDMLKKAPTLRKLMLGMQTRPRPSPSASATMPHTLRPLFLSVDAATRFNDRGSFVVTYAVDNAEEAEEKIKNLLSYLIHDHGDSATYWFNPTAIERADGMKWDEVHNRPITADELDLDDLLNDDVDWIANMEEADKSFKPAQVEVLLTRPSLLHKVSNNPFLGKADSVQTFHQGVSHLPSVSAGDDSANRDAVMEDNSSAGGPGGSLAGAV